MFLLRLAISIVSALTGPDNLAHYPPAAQSPYILPWDADVVRFCVQGNRGIVSHHPDDGTHAWDFAMPTGSNIRAARGGKVVTVIDHHESRGPRAPNNRIVIAHGDGTSASYLHLRKDGALVAVGDEIRQGDLIAESGNVGRSMLPHLHFHVGRNGKTIPITFRDPSAMHHHGIPRMGGFYRAQP